MSNKSIEKILARFKNVIYLVLLAAGIVLILFATSEDKTNGILLGIGCSLIASSSTSLILLLCFSGLQDKDTVQEEWGLVRINNARDFEIKGGNIPKHNLDFMAFGLNSFVQSNSTEESQELIIGKIINGLKVRIITLHPQSIYVEEQQSFENQKTSLSEEIEKLSFWVESINKKLSDRGSNGRIEILFYNSLPLSFYCRSDNKVFIGPYLPNETSKKVITYEYGANSKGGDYYINLFDAIWKGEKNSISFVKKNDILIKSNLSNSINTILKYFCSLIQSSGGPTIGIIVIFKNGLRRTFYSCNKLNDEKHKCYDETKGAFGEFLALNKNASKEHYHIILKDYENRIFVDRDIREKSSKTTGKTYCADKKEMDNSGVIMLAPIFYDNTLIGSTSFEFANFPNAYIKEINNGLYSSGKSINRSMTIFQWFDAAKNCAEIVSNLLGNQAKTDFDKLYYGNDWTE